MTGTLGGTTLTQATTLAATDRLLFLKKADTTTSPASSGGSNQFITPADAATAFSKLHMPAFNVKDYGAVGDGTTNDQAAIQAAITAGLALSAGTAKIYFPPGNYLSNSALNCTSASGSGGYGVMLAGAGRQASTITKGFNGALCTYSGSGGFSGNPTGWGGTADITLAGNGTHTGALLTTESAQQMFFLNTSFVSNPDVTISLVSTEDCYFSACTSNNCGSTTAPVLSIADSSDGTSNMLWFEQCRFESFLNGAVWIKSPGNNGANNGFFFSQCKFETTTVRGDLFVADGATQQLIFDQCFFSLDSFASGYSTPANAIAFGTSAYAAGGNQFSLTNTYVHSATGLLNSVLNVNGAAGAMGGPVIARNVYIDSNPVTSALIYNGCVDCYVRWSDVITGGTLVSGDGSYYSNGFDNSFDYNSGFATQGTLAPSTAYAAFGGFGKGLGVSGITNNTGAYIFGVLSSTDTGAGPSTGSLLVTDGGVASSKGGWDSSGSAVASTPTFTSGTAKQLSTAADSMLYITVVTGATFTIAMGSTSSAANVLINNKALTATAFFPIKVPKGWYVKITGTIADLTFVQVTG